MALFSNKSMRDWISEYAKAHQHPVNKRCHRAGIPMIALSILLLPLLWWWPQWWPLLALLFVVGWILQFIGHVYEGKPPEFLRDWRFLFVGLRWWIHDVFGPRR